MIKTANISCMKTPEGIDPLGVDLISGDITAHDVRTTGNHFAHGSGGSSETVLRQDLYQHSGQRSAGRFRTAEDL